MKMNCYAFPSQFCFSAMAIPSGVLCYLFISGVEYHSPFLALPWVDMAWHERKIASCRTRKLGLGQDLCVFCIGTRRLMPRCHGACGAARRKQSIAKQAATHVVGRPVSSHTVLIDWLDLGGHLGPFVVAVLHCVLRFCESVPFPISAGYGPASPEVWLTASCFLWLTWTLRVGARGFEIC